MVPYEIEFADTATNHLAALTARERSVAIDAIERQLSYEPLVETRSRKLLRPNPIAAVVSMKNIDREVLSLSRSPQFLKIIEQSRRDFSAGRSRSLAQVRDLFGLYERAKQRSQTPRKKRVRG